MQLKSRYIARLLALSLLLSTLQMPSMAQGLPLSKNRHPQVVSVVEDTAGNFLLLNLQSSTPLSAPGIQYLPMPDGQTIMVADFYGLQWQQESRIFRPAEREFDIVRIGQFQANPPIFRISVSSYNPAALRRLEFSCQSNSLLVRFPSPGQTSLAAKSVAPLQAVPSLKKVSKVPSLKSTNSGTTSGGNKKTDIAALKTEKANLPAIANTRTTHVPVEKVGPLSSPPFRKGGLYLSLADASQPSDQSSEPDKASPSLERRSASAATGTYAESKSTIPVLRPLSPEMTTSIENLRPRQVDKTDEKNVAAVSKAEIKKTEKPNEKISERKNELKNSTATKTWPPIAPERTASGRSVLPTEAPDPKKDDNRSTETSSAETKSSQIRTVDVKIPDRKLATQKTQAQRDTKFDLKPEQKIASETKIADLKEKTEAEKAAEEKSITDLTNTPNPTVEFSGKEPLKVKLKFSSKVSYKEFKLSDPPRYVLDMEGLDFRYLANQEPEANPWLKAVRFGNPEENQARIVFDLTKDDVHVDSSADPSGQTLTLSLSNETASPVASVNLRGRTVVLDAGHGGSDPGAQRGDIQEKEITLAITTKLKRYLEEHGARVLMTRSDDTFVSLEDRVKITKETRPNAFVSIHINSLETDRDIKGIETYYNTEQSRALADKIHANLVEGLKVPDRSVRKARFYVVNHTEHPSVLAEVGFISNKEERDKLISSDYQAKIAESVGQGVILFLTNTADSSSSMVSAVPTQSSSFANRIVPTMAKQGLSAVKQISVETDHQALNSKKIAQKKSKID